MRRNFIFIVFFAACLTGLAQKPPLQLKDLDGWIEATRPEISADENYYFYQRYIFREAAYHGPIVVRSLHQDWQREYDGARAAAFTGDSRLLVIQDNRDMLCLVSLPSGEQTEIAKVTSFKLLEGSNPPCLAYTPADTKDELVLHDLATGHEQHFSSVARYYFSDDNSRLLLVSKTTPQDNGATTLHWVDLTTGTTKVIWQGGEASDYAFSGDGRQLAFVSAGNTERNSCSGLWRFEDGADRAVQVVDNVTPGMEANLQVAPETLRFSQNGRQIFFDLRKPTQPASKAAGVRVDVWSYKDTWPQMKIEGEQFAAVWNRDTRQVIQLNREHEFVWPIRSKNSDYVIVCATLGGSYAENEAYWNKQVEFSFYLVSSKDGRRKLLRSHVQTEREAYFPSPDGKWLTFTKVGDGDCYSYQIATGAIRDLTHDFKTGRLAADTTGARGSTNSNLGNMWLARDAAVLIPDAYDVWLIDPTGIAKPRNLTKGYGQAHHIAFRVIESAESLQKLRVNDSQSILLAAFSSDTKDSGFYRIQLNSSADPEKLTMGHYVYSTYGEPEEGIYTDGGYAPEEGKAKSGEIYIVNRMSATEASNYFLTRDFGTFTQLTDSQPQKAFNWLTSELIKFQLPDGTWSQGILYKPENFDPAQKYPVVFDYYEERSHELNWFIRAHRSEGRINIPYFVSNGYLVFVPDIAYKIGEPGTSACISVEAAANHLATMPFVDQKRLGLQGHSFGGYETNYIVTHSTMFAAACSASGLSDLMSSYGSEQDDGYPMYAAERQQIRMGVMPWENPAAYIAESPIWQADRVTTPLLILQNKGDTRVPFVQGMEFFTSLRRLGKKVWLLQYDKESHAVFAKENSTDFTIRMMQFFDYYLKGALPPRWMTEGVPARLKGIETGLELDASGKAP